MTIAPIDWKAIGAKAKAEAKALAPNVAAAVAADEEAKRIAAECRAALTKAERASAEAFFARTDVENRHAFARDIARAVLHKNGLAALDFVTGQRRDEEAFDAAKRRGWAYQSSRPGYAARIRISGQGEAIADAVKTITTPKEPTQ
jgi:hypothetical protein